MSTKKNLYAVYGASGYGREVMPLAYQQLCQQGGDPESLVFVDDTPGPAYINGRRLMTYADFLKESAYNRYVVIAIANSTVREKIANNLASDGIHPWEIKAENLVVMDEISIAEGAIFSPFVTLTSNIRIGRFFHANIYSYVAHDCVIGDFVTFAPGVRCNGNILIEDHAYIGTGAIIKQGAPDNPLVIGRGAVVGMGAVVTKSVPPGAVVVGNPAKQLEK
jgi:sugar O-acyltransferase (sialic acid O-acetyltransferase NeuD family)